MATSLHQVLENEDETLYSTPLFRSISHLHIARRTPSFSSSDSSSFSYNDQFLEQSPPFSPSTPLKYKGIPFSWEKIPGISKHHIPSKEYNESSGYLIIPPPPARNSSSSARKLVHREKKDPFFKALLECSKDGNGGDVRDHHDMMSGYGNIFKGSTKVTRTLSDRFGLMSMLYGSCKSTCAVSESVVYIPRSSRTHDPPHYLLNRRSS